MIRRPFIASCLFVLCLSGTGALAQQANDDPIARGVALRRAGKNAEALVEFRRAYERAPSPQALAQVALAEQALGAWVAAERDLLAALGSPSDAWITRNLAALSAALETLRDHLSTLYVETDVPAAVVYVTGEAVGSTPLPGPVRAPVGEVEVAARRAGEPVRTLRLTLLPRREHHVTLTLSSPTTTGLPAAPLPAPHASELRSRDEAARASTPPSPGEEATAARTLARTDGVHESRSEPAPAARRDGSARFERSTGAVALTLSGALLAGAITANVVRQHYARQYNDDSYCGPGYTCTRVRDAVHRYQTLAIVGYATAGALLVTGAALLIAGHRRAAQRVRLEPYALPHGAGLTYRGTF